MTIDEFLTNRWLRLLIPIALGIIVWAFFRDNFSTMPETINRLQCEEMAKVMRTEIKGVVVIAYQDSSNRPMRTLKYYDGKDTVESPIFNYEASDFIFFLNPGDSIQKRIGSLEFRVRGKRDTTHVLYFDCKPD